MRPLKLGAPLLALALLFATTAGATPATKLAKAGRMRQLIARGLTATVVSLALMQPALGFELHWDKTVVTPLEQPTALSGRPLPTGLFAGLKMKVPFGERVVLGLGHDQKPTANSATPGAQVGDLDSRVRWLSRIPSIVERQPLLEQAPTNPLVIDHLK